MPEQVDQQDRAGRLPPKLDGISSSVQFADPLKGGSHPHIIEEEIQTLLLKGAITRLHQVTPGFYSRFFIVPKRSGGVRPVLDLSALNQFLRPFHFQMETAARIRLTINPGDWATSIDLQDAYFHILVRPYYRKYLRFVWKEQVYQFVALPFGLASAPYIFSKVVREFMSMQRAQGHRVRDYLDDWLVLANSKEKALLSTNVLLMNSAFFGFQIKPEKCDLTPSQTFNYLGMTFDTVSFTVRPSAERIEGISHLIASISNGQEVSRRRLHRLLGVMESVSTLLPLGRVFKRPLQREVLKFFSKDSPWDAVVPLGPWFTTAVIQWTNQQWLHSSVPIRPRQNRIFLYSDASLTGWGAHCCHGEVSGRWTVEEARSHINWLELKAISLALVHFLPHIVNSWVVICGDNTTSLAYLKKGGGTRSLSLSLLAEEILIWAHTHQIHLDPEFVPGNLNVVADNLSRVSQIITTEWTIDLSVLEIVWQAWGRPVVDLFATKHNNRLPIYVSPVRDPEAMATNAFAIPWNNMNAYAYPPAPLVPRCIEKYLLDRPRLILVASLHPSRAWFPDLVSLCHVPPIPLPLDSLTLRQPVSRIGHTNPCWLRLHAWLLCAEDCEHVA